MSSPTGCADIAKLPTDLSIVVDGHEHLCHRRIMVDRSGFVKGHVAFPQDHTLILGGDDAQPVDEAVQKIIIGCIPIEIPDVFAVKTVGVSLTMTFDIYLKTIYGVVSPKDYSNDCSLATAVAIVADFMLSPDILAAYDRVIADKAAWRTEEDHLPEALMMSRRYSLWLSHDALLAPVIRDPSRWGSVINQINMVDFEILLRLTTARHAISKYYMLVRYSAQLPPNTKLLQYSKLHDIEIGSSDMVVLLVDGYHALCSSWNDFQVLEIVSAVTKSLKFNTDLGAQDVSHQLLRIISKQEDLLRSYCSAIRGKNKLKRVM